MPDPAPDARRPIDVKIERAVLNDVLIQACGSPRDPADAIWGAATAMLRLRAFMVEHGLAIGPYAPGGEGGI